MLAEAEDQAHLVNSLDRVARALGGVTNVWCLDRMATVCHPASGAVTASFAAVAKHYGVSVASCPPRRGNRRGVVEKASHTAAQAWWRTLADDVTVEEAQASPDDSTLHISTSPLRPESSSPDMGSPPTARG